MLRVPPLPVRTALASSLALGLVGALGACNAGSGAPPPVAAAAVAPLAVPPGGTGCGPSIAWAQAVVDSDVATGNLNEPVGKRFRADLGEASSACSAGRDGEAMRLLASAKARYGYR